MKLLCIRINIRNEIWRRSLRKYASNDLLESRFSKISIQSVQGKLSPGKLPPDDCPYPNPNLAEICWGQFSGHAFNQWIKVISTKTKTSCDL